MEKNKKHRITFTSEEINVLAHLTRHFSDYVCGDNRPDHGLGILSQDREEMKKFKWDEERTGFLNAFFSSMGKLNRFSRKIR